MIISSKELGPKTFSRHLVARAHRKASRRKMIVAGLMLTSMVDMFSLLVIFLLQNFSASPELMVIAKDVTLPASVSAAEPKDAPVLALSPEGVYLDQKFVGETAVLLRNPEPLMKRLADLRDLWERTHPKEAFPGEINLQAHEGLESTTVAQFMGLLPSQNYGSIQLAVIAGN